MDELAEKQQPHNRPTCIDGTALGTPDSVAVSPDGQSAYVTASTSGAVAVFDREPSLRR